MNFREYRHLLAEKNALDDTLSRLSAGASNALRGPLEHRRSRIIDRLQQNEGAEPDSEVGVIAVDGGSVDGSRSIGMDLAGEVLQHFGHTVTALSGREAVPVLTALVPGSFGFQIEPGEPQVSLIEGVSPTVVAFDNVIKAMVAVSSGNDESVSAAFADFNPSAMAGFKRLMSTLAQHEAVCSVMMGTNSFRFPDVERVKAVSALMDSRVDETEVTWTGRFQGLLPDRLWAEFVPSDSDGSVIVRLAFEEGKAPDDLSDLSGRTLNIRVQRRRVGNSRPRYTVLGYEEAND